MGQGQGCVGADLEDLQDLRGDGGRGMSHCEPAAVRAEGGALRGVTGGRGAHEGRDAGLVEGHHRDPVRHVLEDERGGHGGLGVDGGHEAEGEQPGGAGPGAAHAAMRCGHGAPPFRGGRRGPGPREADGRVHATDPPDALQGLARSRVCRPPRGARTTPARRWGLRAGVRGTRSRGNAGSGGPEAQQQDEVGEADQTVGVEVRVGIIRRPRPRGAAPGRRSPRRRHRRGRRWAARGRPRWSRSRCRSRRPRAGDPRW